jgi:hypothetical protein
MREMFAKGVEKCNATKEVSLYVSCKMHAQSAYKPCQ